MLKAIQDWLKGGGQDDLTHHPLCPRAYWRDEPGAPFRLGHAPLQRHFEFGTGYQKIEFLYTLERFQHRGAVGVVGGGGLATNPDDIRRILRAAQQHVVSNFARDTLATIRSWQAEALAAGRHWKLSDSPASPPPAEGNLALDVFWDPDLAPLSPAVSLQHYFDWPADSAAKQLVLRYFVPLGSNRAVLTVHEPINNTHDLEERKAMLGAAARVAQERFIPETREAITQYWAGREFVKFAEEFSVRVRADAERVAADIRAGKSIAALDWASKSKAPAGILAVLSRHCPTSPPASIINPARAQVQQAIDDAMSTVRSAEQHVAWQRESAEWERQAARKLEDDANRKLRLEGVIYLADDAGRDAITFGTPVDEGEDIQVPIERIQHTLVGGVPGSGKTVFLHSIIRQCLRSPRVDGLVLIDLKGGTELGIYENEPKARVYTDIDGVAAALDSVIALIDRRQVEMRASGLRTYQGGRVFVIIDEFAMINAYMASARAAGQKALATQLANNLRQIVLTARSLGVVLICALQKPTTDAIDSNIKANMGFRLCFRVKTRQAIEAVLDDTDELPVDPRDLRTGRFLFDDGRSNLMRVQAHVPRDLDLSGGW